MTQQSKNGVNKKIFVQLEAEMEVSSSTKNVGNKEYSTNKAASRYYT